MKRHTLLRFAGRLTLVALLVVAVATRVNPKSREPDVEICLCQRAAEVSINTRSLADAIDSLQTAFKTRIELGTPNRWTHGQGSIMRRKNVSMGQALAMVLRLFDKAGDELTYFVKDNQLHIVAEDQDNEDVLIRVYNIRSWFESDYFQLSSPHAFGRQMSPAESMRTFPMEVIRPTIWREQGGLRDAWIDIWSHYLIVSAPPSVQWQMQHLCFQMDYAGPPTIVSAPPIFRFPAHE